MNYYGRDKNIQVKVGIMTVLTVLILFFGYSWLRDWFGKSNHEEFRVMFANAGSIDIGNSVTVYGVKRGRVNDILITTEGVLVTLLVEIDFPLPIDTRFVISDSNLMGSRQLNIIPGNSNTYISEGFIPNGESLGGLSSLFPKIDAVITSVNRLVSLFNEDESVSGKLYETLDKTHRIAVRLDNILESNEEDVSVAIRNFYETSKQLNELLTDNKQNIDDALSGAAGSMEQLDKSLARIDDMIKSLEPLMVMIAEDEGTIHRLLSDEALYERIVSAANTADSLLTDIKENPRRYFRFSIF